MKEWIHKYDEESKVHHYDCPVCNDGYATQYDGAPSAFCQTCGTQLAELSEDAKQALLKASAVFVPFSREELKEIIAKHFHFRVDMVNPEDYDEERIHKIIIDRLL